MSTTATGTYFNAYRHQVLNGIFNLGNGGDVIKMSLIDSGWTPDIDSDEFFSDVAAAVRANEVTGTGYVPGGKTIASQATAQDDSNDVGTFDFANLTWSAATLTARYGVLWVPTLLSISDQATHKWTVSGAQAGEYFCELFGGGDPNFTEPQELDVLSVGAPIGTMGSLAAGEWDFGDNDANGFNSVYFRTAGTTDPDNEAADFVKTIIDATSRLLAYWDFAANIAVSADDLSLNVAAAGAFAN